LKTNNLSSIFILEAIEPETDCVVGECRFQVDDEDALFAIADPSAGRSDLNYNYELSRDDLDQLKSRFDLSFELQVGLNARLRRADRTHGLPYKVHTGRELRMMLNGIKPLAYFYEEHPSAMPGIIPEHLFDPHVAAGRFVKRDYVDRQLEFDLAHRLPRMRVVLYALAHEAWRIDAFIVALETARKTGWNESIERVVGTLLGYEEWQNDAYIAARDKGGLLT
jgi:hypothetical protein